MKRLIALPVITIILFASSFQCRRDNGDAAPLLKGKLVMNGPCGIYGVEVLDGNIDPSKVTSSWKNPFDGIVYTNIFRVANPCTFGGAGLSQGDIFTFRLDANPPPETCMLCMVMIYTAVPPLQNAVKDVQKLK